MQAFEITMLVSALVFGYSFLGGITWVLLPDMDDKTEQSLLCIIWPIILPALIVVVITVRWLQHRHQNRVPQARIIKKGQE